MAHARALTLAHSQPLFTVQLGFFLLLPLRIPTIIVRNSNAWQRLAYAFPIKGILFWWLLLWLRLWLLADDTFIISRGIQSMEHINRYSFDFNRKLATIFKRFHLVKSTDFECHLYWQISKNEHTVFIKPETEYTHTRGYNVQSNVIYNVQPK